MASGPVGPRMRVTAAWAPAAGSASIGILLLVSSLLVTSGTAFGMPPPGASHAPSLVRSDDWPTYFENDQRTGYNPHIVSPNVANITKLSIAWTRGFSGPFDGSLIVVNGVVYAGSENGQLYAVRAATGANLAPSRWTTPFLGNTSQYAQCGVSGNRGGNHDGLTSTATFARGSLWEDGGYPAFYHVARNGTILATLDVANSSVTPWYYDYEWGSPLIVGDRAYVPTAALCEYDNGQQGHPNLYKYVQGELLLVSLASMTITHIFRVVKGANVTDAGGSIWSSPSFDPVTNTVWVTTGNANQSWQSPNNGEYAQSIVALNASNLRLRGGCQVVATNSGSALADEDFGAGATVFNDSKGDRYVGAVNKDGYFYAINATDFSGGANTACNGGALKLAWTSGYLGYSGSGDISPAAFDGNRLYLTYGSMGGSANGFVDALNPANGHAAWSKPFPLTIGSTDYYAFGGVSTAAGIVYVDAVNAGGFNGGALFAVYANNGTLAYSHAFNETIAGPPVVAEGMVFVATGWDGGFTGRGYIDALAP
ncbi:MAG TPA: PQQ-binding-like beta-propeller repeat protein [Thermoplasmata archaeon]|nr:PQQ-binding-like beta-propeller repeat protein [Thermoplasmata archaeon]